MQKNSEFTIKKVRSLKYLKGVETKNSNAFATVFSSYQYSLRKQLHDSMRQVATMSLVYFLSAGLVFYPFFANFTKVSADPTTTLTVVTTVTPSFGGTAVPSDFTMSLTGTNLSNSSFAGSSSGVDVNLDAGAYTVTPSGPSGYNFSYSGACFSTIAMGGHKTCTIDAEDQPAGVNVTVNVVNTNGGTKTPADFTVNTAAVNAAPASAPGNAAGTMVNMNSGSYTITENAVAGYTQNFSADCTGTVASGQVKFCTITNSDAVAPTTATVTVTNNVLNNYGGIATAANFIATVVNSSSSPSSFTTTSTGTPVTVQPGAYSISASGPAGYGIAYSTDCTGTTVAGNFKVCTITSTDPSPVSTTSDISITNVATSTTPSAGDTVKYTLTVKNNGLAVATNVVATDTLPSGLTYVSNVPSQGTFNSGTGLWTIGTLANGASATLTLNATVNIATGGQTLTNTATVSATQVDPVPANNSASASVIVNNLAPVISNELTPSSGTNSINITWTSDHPATSRVVYDTTSHTVGAAPNYGYPNTTVEDSTLVLNHSVTITGLTAGTTYFLRPVSHGSPEAVGSEVSIATAAISGGGGGGGSGGGGSSSAGSASGGSVIPTSPIVSPVAQTTPPGLAFVDPNLQGQVLGASTNIPSSANSGLPKTGVPAQALLILILLAGAAGVGRYKYYKV